MATSNQNSFNSIGPLPITQSLFEELMKRFGFAPQQRRVCELILRGATDKVIARTLGIGEPTIRTYLDRMFRKASVGSRMELVLKLFAASHELVRSDGCHQE